MGDTTHYHCETRFQLSLRSSSRAEHFHCHCHENTLICLDELYAHVIPAQAGIQDDRSLGSCFRSTDRQSRCEHATFSSSVVPLASGMLDCDRSEAVSPFPPRPPWNVFMGGTPIPPPEGNPPLDSPYSSFLLKIQRVGTNKVNHHAVCPG